MKELVYPLVLYSYEHKNNTKFAFEIIAMIVIVLAIGLQSNLGKVLVEDPFPNVVIPLIMIGSYIYILRKK